LTLLEVDKETLRLLVKRRAMLRVLSILVKQKENTLPTRILLRKLGANNLLHLILQAEKEGYIYPNTKRKKAGKAEQEIRVIILTTILKMIHILYYEIRDVDGTGRNIYRIIQMLRHDKQENKQLVHLNL
jgi:hypothetical protein